MKMEVGRYGIEIIPESQIDEAYIEEVLGLKKEDDICICRRGVIGEDRLAFIVIEREKRLSMLSKGL